MKKVFTIVSLSIVGLLILATIIMACIPVAHNPKFGDPYTITIYSSKFESGISQKDYDKVGSNAEEYKNLLKELKDAPSQKALVALFNGTISQGVEIVKLDATEVPSKSNSETNVAMFELKYGEEQSIKYDSKTDVTYNSMFYKINQDAGRVKTTVYLLNSLGRASYTLEYYGNFDSLFNYINTLINGEQA